MSNLIFDADSSSNPYIFQKPRDNFNVEELAPNTIFYLSIIKPHIDSHEIVGPSQSFRNLLPKIESIISDSPRAIEKFEELKVIEDIWGERTDNEDFFLGGFHTFIVPGQRDIYTVMRIHRETNRQVREELPSPVYTVIAVGPLSRQQNMLATLSKPGTPGKLMGRAVNTRIMGSWVDRQDAAAKAREVMDEMTKEKAGVKRGEQWDKNRRGGGMLMAMGIGEEWEVKVVYEDEVHRRAKDWYAWQGEELEWRF